MFVKTKINLKLMRSRSTIYNSVIASHSVLSHTCRGYDSSSVLFIGLFPSFLRVNKLTIMIMSLFQAASGIKELIFSWKPFGWWKINQLMLGGKACPGD